MFKLNLFALFFGKPSDRGPRSDRSASVESATPAIPTPNTSYLSEPARPNLTIVRESSHAASDLSRSTRGSGALPSAFEPGPNTPVFSTPAGASQAEIAAATALQLKEIFDSADWAKLMRNARDGGASSILACRILEKTIILLGQGFKQVDMMVAAAQEVRTQTDALASISADIKQVSQQSKIVSINAGIEANRAGEHGRAFHVVAQQMTTLSEDVRGLTSSIDSKITGVNDKIAINRALCEKVGTLFTNMNKELEEFRKLMMRVEELSVVQVQQLTSMEEKAADAVKR